MAIVRWYRQCLYAAAAGVAAVVIASSGIAVAAPSGVTVEIDENGNGTATGIPGMPGSVSLPYIGGLGTGNPLAYDLAVLTGSVQTGTWLITEECEDGDGDAYCLISDVIQFVNLTFTIGDTQVTIPFLVFYSDNSDGADALADTGLPFTGGNAILPCGTRSDSSECSLAEVGPEGDNGVTYTPIRITGGGPPYTDPGFFTSHPVTFIIHSDMPATVPEPATVALLGVGLAALGWSARRRLGK